MDDTDLSEKTVGELVTIHFMLVRKHKGENEDLRDKNSEDNVFIVRAK